MLMDIKIEGLPELMEDVRKAGGDARPLVRAAITNSVNRIQKNVRAKAPHKTGTLQRSVFTTVADLYGIVQVLEKYGEWVENGTGIYGPLKRKIVPTSAKALAFTYMGKKIVVKSVKGMKAQPFFKPGVDASEDYVQSQFDKVGDILINELAGRE